MRWSSINSYALPLSLLFLNLDRSDLLILNAANNAFDLLGLSQIHARYSGIHETLLSRCQTHSWYVRINVLYVISLLCIILYIVYIGNILASIRAERRGCRSHWSLLSVGHHLSPTFSHLWTHSRARRGSACPQGAPQLHQPISWAFTGPLLEASSWSSTWQVDRPAPKR